MSGGRIGDNFLNLGIVPVRTGVFNVADVAIALGVLLVYPPASRAPPPPTPLRAGLAPAPQEALRARPGR